MSFTALQNSKISGVQIGTTNMIQDKYFKGLTEIYNQQTVSYLNPNPS